VIGGKVRKITYRFVSSDFRVVRDVALDILAPDDRMILVGFEELRDILSSRIKSIEPLLAEHIGEVLLYGHNGSGSEVIVEDPDSRECLATASAVE
jgi:hypothetical protein